MANEDVNLTFTADAEEAKRAWAELAAAPQKYEDALRRISQLEEKSSKSGAAGLENMLGKWFSIAAAISAATKAANEHYELVLRMEREKAQSTLTVDTAMRQYFIAAKIGDPQQQAAAQAAIGNVAIAHKASPQSAGATAAAAARFNVGLDQLIGGGVLGELLDLQDVSTTSGKPVDPKAILELLHRQKRPITAESIRQLGAQAYGYTGRIPGFGSDTMEEFKKVAALTSDPDALGIFGEIMTEKEPRLARTEFTDLFDSKHKAGEAKRMARYRAMLAADAGGDIQGEYAAARGIASQSVANTVQQTATAGAYSQAQSGKRLTRAEMEKNIETIMSQAGAPDWQTRFEMQMFDNPPGPNWLYGGDEAQAQRAASRIGFFRAKQAGREGANPQDVQGVYEEITGKRDISVRIKGPDGRDVPTEPAAAALGGGFSVLGGASGSF